VKAFQRSRKLVVNGVAGPETLAALGLVGRPVKKRAKPTKRPAIFVGYSHTDKNWIKRLQVHLEPLDRTS